MTNWLTITIVALVVLLLMTFFLINKRKKQPVDYYNIFVMGFLLLVTGFPLQNETFYIIGVIFMISGLSHRDKWKKTKK